MSEHFTLQWRNEWIFAWDDTYRIKAYETWKDPRKLWMNFIVSFFRYVNKDVNEMSSS